MTTFHFISGLPRSGSTLLSALLGQNPRINANITSPVLRMYQALLPLMSGKSAIGSQFDDEQRLLVLRGVFEGYHKGAAEIAFDTNRGWTSQLPLLAQIYPEAKVICCVKDVSEILNSLEAAIQRHPTHYPTLLESEGKHLNTQYIRVAAYMNFNHGMVGFAWAGLREAWFGPCASRLVLVQYDRLVEDPQGTLDRIYRCIDQDAYQHTFDNLFFRQDTYPPASE